MASPTLWAWVWVNSGSWWWTGRPGVLRSMGSQRAGHDWVTELSWTELIALPRRLSGKESAYNAGDLSLIPGSGRSLEKGMATHSSILAWRIPWTEEPGGLQSAGSQRVGHDWAWATTTDSPEYSFFTPTVSLQFGRYSLCHLSIKTLSYGFVLLSYISLVPTKQGNIKMNKFHFAEHRYDCSPRYPVPSLVRIPALEKKLFRKNRCFRMQLYCITHICLPISVMMVLYATKEVNLFHGWYCPFHNLILFSPLWPSPEVETVVVPFRSDFHKLNRYAD